MLQIVYLKYLNKIMQNKEKIKVSSDYLLLDALKLMDDLSCKLLIVMNGNKFLSVLSIGDIQRAILKKIPLNTKIKKILRGDISISSNNDSIDKIKERIFELRAECMPVVDKNNNLVEIYFWEDFFSKSRKINNKLLDLPVIIMAGGKGKRLKPLTNILPKPLIPIGDKTIIEEIMSKFISIGSNNFYLSLFHKAELIKYYFNEKNNKEYILNFFVEDKPLGTAGSLFLLKNKLNKTFFVTNCDIIIDQDYGEIYKYHTENNNEITIVSALSHFKFPYGVIETGKDGKLISIEEKPQTPKSNYAVTGLYVYDSSVCELSKSLSPSARGAADVYQDRGLNSTHTHTLTVEARP